jgi:predicted protein tyrosine phosphatase
MQEELQRRAQSLKKAEIRVREKDGTVTTQSREGAVLRQEERHYVLIEAAKDETVGHIMTGLYIGSQDAAECLETLSANGIEAILNVGFSEAVFEEFEYKRLPLYDTEEQKLAIDEQLLFLSECLKREKKVLVHCNAGVSRSASVAIAYLIRYEQLSYEEAFATVKKARPSIRPNHGFVEQLKKFK